MNTPQIHLDTRVVKIAALVPNPWNPNRMDERLYASTRESIRTNGFVDPVTVCIPKPGNDDWPDFPTWEKGTFLIVDGEHRWKAAQDEEMTEIAVNILPLTQAKARRLTLIMLQHGDPEASSLLQCLKVLEEEMGEDARLGLPYESADIAKLKRIAEEAEGGGAGGEEFAFFSFHVAESAAKVIHAAISRVQKDQDLTNQGTAFEYICADFLAGLPEEEVAS